ALAGAPRARSRPRLVVGSDEPHGAHDLVGQPGGLVGGRRGGQEARTRPAVDRRAGVVELDQVGVAVVLHRARDAVQRLVPGDVLEAVAARAADARTGQAGLGLDVVLERRALGAERAAVGRVVGVALDVDQLGLFAGREVAARVHDDPARHRAVGADVAGFGGGGEL